MGGDWEGAWDRGGVRKVVACGLHRPPCFDTEDHESAPSGTEKFWVCAFLGFAGVPYLPIVCRLLGTNFKK